MATLERTDTFLSQARTLRSWQLFAFFLVVGHVVTVAAFARLALSTRLVPYLVEIDKDGSATFAGPLQVADLPEERLLVAQLRDFLWNLRVVVNDPPAQQELIARAYALADAPLRRKLDEHFALPENDPRAIAPRASRSVEAITILALPGTAKTFQIHWREVESDRLAIGSSRVRRFQGLLTVSPVRLESVEAMLANPLGILITDFNWVETLPSREVEP